MVKQEIVNNQVVSRTNTPFHVWYMTYQTYLFHIYNLAREHNEKLNFEKFVNYCFNNSSKIIN